jgi:hypothetical protein
MKTLRPLDLGDMKEGDIITRISDTGLVKNYKVTGWVDIHFLLCEQVDAFSDSHLLSGSEHSWCRIDTREPDPSYVLLGEGYEDRVIGMAVLKILYRRIGETMKTYSM